MRNRSTKVRLFIREELSPGLDIALSAHQAKYLFRVMRIKMGEVITILDGKTGEYEAKIVQKGIKFGKIRVGIKKANVQKPSNLWLLFSPLRKNRTEWLVEKATELGVQKMIPIIMSRTVDTNIRTSRLESIMIEALEQCGGTFLPELAPPIPLVYCLKSWDPTRQLIFCDESKAKTNNKNSSVDNGLSKKAGIIVGPEGGFSEAEAKLIRNIENVISVSLGPAILRADTAAVSAITIWRNSIAGA